MYKVQLLVRNAFDVRSVWIRLILNFCIIYKLINIVYEKRVIKIHFSLLKPYKLI